METIVTSWKIKDANGHSSFIYIGVYNESDGTWVIADGYTLSDTRLSYDAICKQKAAIESLTSLNRSKAYNKSYGYIKSSYPSVFTKDASYFYSYEGDISIPGTGDGTTSVEVVDNLMSTSAIAALSANQGRELSESINRLSMTINTMTPIVISTQDAYDELSEKDESTLYVIVS